MGFDGLTQSTDLDGNRDVPPAVQPLYDDPADPESMTCADPEPVPDLDADVVCRIDVTTTPYANGVGWAENTSWRVITLAASLANVTTPDGSTYAATSADGTITLDDTDPVGTAQTIGTDDATGLGDIVLVFDGDLPGSLLQVDRTFELERTASAGPDSASYQVVSATPSG